VDFNADGKKDLIVGDADGLVFVFLNEGTNAAPRLAAPQRLIVDGEPYKWAGTRIKPDVVDFNGDGLFDLVFGEERGKVLLLLNSGTKTEPKFMTAVPLKDGEKDLKVWMRGDPCVVDFDGDGKKDLLVADEGGKIIFFRNRGTDVEPVFNGSETLRAKGWPLCPGSSGYFRADMDGDGRPETIAANNKGVITIYKGAERVPLQLDGKTFASEHGRPSIQNVDWNDDGLFDILIAEKSGAVGVAVNTGSKEGAKFETLTVLSAGDAPVNGGTGASARFEDIDGDGKKDLLCFDENAVVRVFRNKGTAKSPVLETIETPEKDSSEICGGYRSRLDVVDWNNDGALDIVYGVTSSKDSRCRVYVFLRSK
jgi:FG-GAP-like repeat